MAEQMMIPIAEVPAIVEKRSNWKPDLRTVRSWASSGKINGRKIGGRMFVCKISVEEMLDGKDDSEE